MGKTELVLELFDFRYDSCVVFREMRQLISTAFKIKHCNAHSVSKHSHLRQRQLLGVSSSSSFLSCIAPNVDSILTKGGCEAYLVLHGA